MNANERVERIFNQAVEIESPSHRDAFLQGACGEDAELRRRVEQLIHAHEAAGGFLKVKTGAEAQTVVSQTPLTEGPGTVIGRYKLLQQIGEGGMGVVYMAEQEEPVRRKVALKVIKLGMDTRQVVARFEAERQALALMDHPNIAKVLDAGATESGRPYFVMELVRGVPITEYCDKNHLGARERLELFLPVCHAIQHAHQKGVIHRDIKPSNVLVTLHDSQPVPMVIDFGVAKATNQKLTEKTLFTQFAAMIGTPAYMSPEQAELSGLDIDTRSDIYSLGVLLYELLTGKTPFDAQELVKAGLDELRRTIREVEPVKPSTRLTQELVAADVRRLKSKTEIPDSKAEEDTRASSHRLLQVKETIALLRGDLDWIVMKCLEKDRTRRYETANGLAMDLKRHLDNEPVVARPPSAAYRFQKLVRRNKLAFAAAAAIASVLVLGVVVSTWQAIRATRAQREQTRLRQKAENARAGEVAQRQRAEGEKQRAEAGELAARQNLYAADMSVAQQSLAENNRSRALESLRHHIPKSGGPRDLRGFEWYYLWDQARSDERQSLSGHTDLVGGVVYSRGGQWLATAGDDRTIQIWEVASNRLLKTVAGFTGWIESLAFTPDDRTLIAAWEHGIAVYDTESWTQELALPDGYRRLALSRDGTKLATEGKDGVILWDTKVWKPIPNFPKVDWPCAFAPDGKLLAAKHRDEIVLCDLDTLTTRTLPHGWPTLISFIAFSSDGRTLAAPRVGLPEVVKLWDLETLSPIGELAGHSLRIFCGAFSLDGKILATGGTDQTIRLWDIATKTCIAVLRGHEDEVWAVAFARDGKTLASGGKDSAVKLWDVKPKPADEVFSKGSVPLGFSRDSQTLLTVTTNAVLRRLHVADGRVSSELQLAESGHMRRECLSPDGEVLVVGLPQEIQRLFDTRTGTHLGDLRGQRGDGSGPFVAWSPNSKLIAAHLRDAGVLLYDRASRKEVSRLENARWPMTFSPDGTVLATTGLGRDDQVVLWEVATKRSLRSFGGFKLNATTRAFSPDGQFIAISGGDKSIKIWRIASNDPPVELIGHKQGMTEMVFSPDGQTLVTCSDDRTIKFWNVATRQETLTFTSRAVNWDERWLIFAPNGQTLAMASVEGDYFMRLWRAPSGSGIESAETAQRKTP